MPERTRARSPSEGTAAPAPSGEAPSRWLRGHVPGEVGIWIFILGDITLYAVLFGSFMVDRSKDVELFNEASATLHASFGAINALLLLTSSLFVALGVRAVRPGIAQRLARILFSLAIVCSLGFIFNKYLEYSDLLSDGLDPTTNSFYVYYYVLTGIHLTHLLAGTAVLFFLQRISGKAAFEEKDVRASESGASFWHVVDLLWIVLFALLYLVR
jgi:nitric oxide reductase NorE protein